MTASTSFATDQRPSDDPTAKTTRRSGCRGRPRFRGTSAKRPSGDPHDPIRQDDEEPPEVIDPPEAIINGIIDLGRLATDALFLAIDPYPRKPGAVFEAEVVALDPEDHPFAALKALQDKKKGQ